MNLHLGRVSKPRLLVLIAAHDAEKTIQSVVRRVPPSLSALYDVHVLIIDDSSADSTFRESFTVSRAEDLSFPVCVLFNSVSQGYGGNQKLGFRYAVENDFNFVALLRGDGRFGPESLPALLAAVSGGKADAAFGSRMPVQRHGFARGLPRPRSARNKVFLRIDKKLRCASLADAHSGYRVYSVAALRAVPFERNSNGLLFDTEIVIQFQIAQRSIVLQPVAGYRGDEICPENRFTYTAGVITTLLKACLQRLSLFYDRRFDCAPEETYSPYTPKLDYESPHTMALERVAPGSRVLDLGCASGYLGSLLRTSKQCHVSGIDKRRLNPDILDEFSAADLNEGPPDIDANRYDVVLMLDVIEHLNQPELFLEGLSRKLALNPAVELMISTANVACFVTRAMLLAGQFNYGPRGILDVTHTRLFTFASFRRALEQAGFDVLETRGVAAPFPLAIGNNRFSRALLWMNHDLIGLSRGLFSYQIFMRVKARPSLELLLATAVRQSGVKASVIEREAFADTVHS